MPIARSLLSVIFAASLVAAPSLASAAPADVSQARVSSQVEGEEDLRGGGVLLPVAFLVAIVLAVILMTGGDEVPQSPG